MSDWPTHRYRAAKRRAARTWKQRRARQERRRATRGNKGVPYRVVSR